MGSRKTNVGPRVARVDWPSIRCGGGFDLWLFVWLGDGLHMTEIPLDRAWLKYALVEILDRTAWWGLQLWREG